MRIIWTYLAVAAVVLAQLSTASAAPIAQPAFERLWQRTGVPIQRGVADYSWVWGPEPFTPQLMEANAESPSGRRAVQYFDKSRMEINNPSGDPSSPWFVTNGLLVNELISGRVQVGAGEFIPLAPANIPIAGDPSNTFPTYASLVRIYNTPAGREPGDHVTDLFLPEGAGELPQYADSPATEIVRVERGFGIPRAFWDFMNRTGTVYEGGRLVPNQPLFDWVFTLGYPTTDAFWTRVTVGGVERDVMFQAFERRVLTYTPDNPQPYQVEMGNVGRHYYHWRYEAPFADGAEALITVPEPGALVSPPLLVQGFGSGSAFEGAITVRLKDAAGRQLASVNTQVLQPDVGLTGPFEATLTFTPPPEPSPATIEVITRSPRDGSEILLASREVRVTHDGPPPALDEQMERARRDLSRRLKLDLSEIRVVSVEPAEWPGGSLGCPAPERVYTLEIVPGYRLTLEAQGQRYTYHVDQGERLVYCRDGRPVLGLASTADELIAALRERGYAIEDTGVVRQPFLRTDGRLYRISGGGLAQPVELQVYGYAEEATAAEDAASIGPDGQPEGAIVDWVAPPYFYRSWRVLAIYVGDSQAALQVLNDLLGPPFAVPSPSADQARIPWDEARALLLAGQVRFIAQSHSLNVQMTLADGRVLTTVEPRIDEIFRVIEECGEPCASTAVATE